jgi:hypothetical protein
MSLTVHNKPADFEEDVNNLDVMQHAHYPTGEHVTTPVTYKYPQSVRCNITIYVNLTMTIITVL